MKEIRLELREEEEKGEGKKERKTNERKKGRMLIGAERGKGVIAHN
jgi:hypothetical protein